MIKTKRTSKRNNKKKRLILLISVLFCAAIALFFILRGTQPPAPVVDLPATPDASTPVEPESEAVRIQTALEAARTGNPDVIGWLTVDGAEIDEAVVQAADNDKYLRRTIESSDYDVWGCYFADYECDLSAENSLSNTTIIYGHALDDDPDAEMFSKLKRFKDKAFAAAHPTITLGLDGALLTFEIFAASNIPISINYIDPTPAAAELQSTLDYLQANRFVSYDDVMVSTDDRILILSTCTSDDNVRYVVAAKLIDTPAT